MISIVRAEGIGDVEEDAFQLFHVILFNHEYNIVEFRGGCSIAFEEVRVRVKAGGGLSESVHAVFATVKLSI